MSIRALSLVLLLQFGCTRDRDRGRVLIPRDVGPVYKDSGIDTADAADSGFDTDTGIDTGIDTGMHDSGFGMDAMTPDQGSDPCPNGTEGCQCNSTIAPTDTMFLQDDCASGQVCVPWDLLAGVEGNVVAPVHSCVRPCTSDAQCGSGRFCKDMGFTPQSGAQRICVDDVAGLDEFCSGSRGTVSRLPMVQRQNGGRMLGCPGNMSCAIGFFSDVHPDEGICVDLCTGQADCGGATPYCNLLFPDPNGGPSSGVCSIGALGVGALCGPIDNPNSVGLTRRCDAAITNNGCVAVNNVFPAGTGFCAAICDNTLPCTQNEAGIGNYTCTAAPGGTNGEGYCTIGCSKYPENCSGAGFTGFGRMCYDDLAFNPPTGNPVPLAFCLDRHGPPLSPTLMSMDGMSIAVQGSNCSDPIDMLGFTKCPDETYCQAFGAGQGLCVYGCDRDPSPVPQGGCDASSPTAVCTPALNDMTGNPDPERGLCSD